MSRSRTSLDEAATALMADCLENWPRAMQPLISGDRTGSLPRAFLANGASPTVWLREASLKAKTPATLWPPEGSFDLALVRMPKSKAALDLALAAVAARVAPGTPIVVFGANAEGIRSAGSHLQPIVDAVTTIATRNHARVIAGPRKAEILDLRATLADWRGSSEITILGQSRAWISYPGAFAGGGLDRGTEFLLTHLAVFVTPRTARVLDYAAGTGVLAAAIATLNGTAAIDMIEADAIALEAAARNVPAARPLLGDSLAAAAGATYDLIISNPPIHDGIDESHAVLERLIADAPSHMRPDARIVIVVQRRVPIMQLLGEHLASPQIVADDGRFTIATAKRRDMRK